MPRFIKKAKPLWKPIHKRAKIDLEEITSDNVISEVSLACVPLKVIKSLVYVFKKASTSYG